MFKTIAEQRAFGHRLIGGVLWGLVLAVTGAALLLKGPWLALGLGAAALAGGATLAGASDKDGAGGRMAIAAALMGLVSLLVAAFKGHPWQIDLHMAYFAALAALVIYCDWRAILAGAAVVAVHHLTLSFLLPAAVFPGGHSPALRGAPPPPVARLAQPGRRKRLAPARSSLRRCGPCGAAVERMTIPP